MGPWGVPNPAPLVRLLLGDSSGRDAGACAGSRAGGHVVAGDASLTGSMT